MAELVERYADLPLGAVDASIAATAERLGEVNLATLDRRHFHGRPARARGGVHAPPLIGSRRWDPSVAADTLGAVITTDFDYPSQKAGLRVPDGPMLLDTCVIQNLMALGEYGEDGRLSTDGERQLLARFGDRYTDELVALDVLVEVFQRNGPPWFVSESSLVELDRVNGTKGQRLREWWFESGLLPRLPRRGLVSRD